MGRDWLKKKLTWESKPNIVKISIKKTKLAKVKQITWITRKKP